MRRKIIIMAVIAMGIMGMTGCKPTEKNYKTAYDAALNKRKAAEALDSDLGITDGKLISLDAPVLRVENGDSVYYRMEPLKFVDGLKDSFHKYNVAVSKYKMQTNCAAQVSDLFEKGYAAFGARNADGEFYVIAGSFNNYDEAVAFDKSFQKKETGHVYTGLPSAPVIIETR